MTMTHAEKVFQVTPDEYESDGYIFSLDDADKALLTDKDLDALGAPFYNWGQSHTYHRGFKVPGEDMGYFYTEIFSKILGDAPNEDSIFTSEVKDDTIIVRIVEVDVIRHKSVWMLVSGVGTDGGFGDYAPPRYGDPLSFEGDYIWFADPDVAHEVAKELSSVAAKRFYSVGEHDTYDGYFPVEYSVVKVPQLSGDLDCSWWSAEDAVDAVTTMHSGDWELKY